MNNVNVSFIQFFIIIVTCHWWTNHFTPLRNSKQQCWREMGILKMRTDWKCVAAKCWWCAPADQTQLFIGFLLSYNRHLLNRCNWCIIDPEFIDLFCRKRGKSIKLPLYITRQEAVTFISVTENFNMWVWIWLALCVGGRKDVLLTCGGKL